MTKFWQKVKLQIWQRWKVTIHKIVRNDKIYKIMKMRIVKNDKIIVKKDNIYTIEKRTI